MDHQVRQPAADVREQVVAAADALFYERGIQAVGMDAVRAAAGVSLKRIYALFGSKDDLIVAVLRHRSAMWDDGLASAVRPTMTARERLLAIFDFLDEWFRSPDFRGCAFINAYGELSSGSPAVKDAVRAHKQAFGEYVARLVTEIGAPPELAPQIALLAEGAQTTAAIAGTPESAHQARAAAQALLDTASATPR
ncbi:TetR/AcrR family transcriptional regulator [Nocardia mexicana]|uniref:TetR family transcriptional regulator n=1 Tax=Nocardia mexicana TaxID=279262 RepID=A0A370HD75_9NOCA|nr:TetR/AcrR family transcriptional regulator [Nocardia mexicana]RDI55178.1 TetR family transcriptional regulator [Nocardia mexicana]